MRGKKTSPEKVEEIKALSLVYSPPAISEKVGVSLRTIHSILAKKDNPVIEKRREEKRLEIVDKVWDGKIADVRELKTKCDLILEGLTKEKVDKARLTELTTAFGTLFDKIRLLQNQSTDNYALQASIDREKISNLEEARAYVMDIVKKLREPNQENE
jgi:hypothetical protein|tara:strand:- start:592 stop:1065 length:474 start_codon:yes stop_codon:yes gene_type:complete